MTTISISDLDLQRPIVRISLDWSKVVDHFLELFRVEFQGKRKVKLFPQTLSYII